MSSDGCGAPSSKRQQLESLEDATNEGECKKEIILSLYFNFQLGKEKHTSTLIFSFLFRTK